MCEYARCSQPFLSTDYIVKCLFEVVFNSIPFRWIHFPYIVFYGQLYVLYSLRLFKRFGVFFYFFLDYEQSYAVLWQLGLFLVVIINALHFILLYWAYRHCTLQLSAFFFGGALVSSAVQSGQAAPAAIAVSCHVCFLLYRQDCNLLLLAGDSAPHRSFAQASSIAPPNLHFYF